MGLETGTGIGDLVPTNPLSTDAVSSGDDHLRLIKTVMQSITFLKSIQTFTASGTWTRPANVKKILVYCLGGGGGGNAGDQAGYAGGGGSGGHVALKFIDVSAIASATITIGVGGVGGAIQGGLGSSGNDTSFVTAGPVTQCLAKGGLSGASFNFAPGGSHDRTLSTGDIVFAGFYGTYGNPQGLAVASFGGQGGGNGGFSSVAASASAGGGGGGGHAGAGVSGNGGAGGSGYCIVFEYGW